MSQIAGAVFDSAPGPWNIQENISHLFELHNIREFDKQELMVRLAYCSVNYVNGMSVKEIVSEARLQARYLPFNLEQHRDVPWVGSFLKYGEKESWPTLFLASKKDRQIPWRYVRSVSKEQERRGRRSSLHLFPSSGHVAHLKVHPEEYRDTVASFMQTLET